MTETPAKALERLREIPLSQGKVAIVDADDYEWLIEGRWYAVKRRNTFYGICKFKNEDGVWKHLYMHRAINKTPDGFETDHIDGDGLNNRRANLRTVTRKQNIWNIQPIRGSSSKYKGVHWSKIAEKWQAQIPAGNKTVWLGLYDSEEDAARAYNIAAVKYRGEFAYINQINEANTDERRV